MNFLDYIGNAVKSGASGGAGGGGYGVIAQNKYFS